MIRHQILEKVKNTVLGFDPSAKLILYGSQARGDARKYSDWDILILSSYIIDKETKKKLRYAILDIEIEEEESISPIIYYIHEWPQLLGLPLHENISKEGIEI